MRGLDTNVLVRFLLRDDELQAKVARDVINSAVEQCDPLLVSLLTLVETEWVLRSYASFSRAEIVQAFKLLLEARDLVFERENVVEEGLRYFEEGKAEFADCLMAVQYRSLGCDAMLTFDRSASKLPGVEILFV